MFEFPPDRGPQRLLYAGRDHTPCSAPSPSPRLRLRWGGPAPGDLVLHGDLLSVAGALGIAGPPRVRLAYLDPPFDTGRAWLQRLHLRGPQYSRRRADLEVEAWQDRWTGDAYLAFIHARLRAVRSLLLPEGVVVLQCDARRAHHIRALCEEVFGATGFLNEIVWNRRPGRANTGQRLDQVTDRILVFANGRKPRLSLPRTRDTPAARAYIERRFTGREPDGRRYMTAPLSSPNPRPNLRYTYEGHTPPPNGWAISRQKMTEWHAQGRLHFVPGGRIYRKVYLDTYAGQPVPDLWTDIPVLNAMASERNGYPTQKPEALLQRIVEMFTEPGDVVLDGFSGSGTAAAVARRLGRHVIAVDASCTAADQTFLRLATCPGRPVSCASLNESAPPHEGGHASVAPTDGRLRLTDVEVPDLVRRLAEGKKTLAHPHAVLAAAAWGTRSGALLDITHLDVPSDGSVLVADTAPDPTCTDVRLWDLRYRAFDAARKPPVSAVPR